MKIEQLIVQHLYTHKKVILQGIGSITLNPAIALPSEGDKDFQIPDNAFSFDYNLKAEQDEALISFVMQQTRKIRPLATADVESYSILSKQFLNIGKPLIIEGVGTIHKSQAGVYEFTSGQFITPRIEEQARPLKDKTAEEVSFESEPKPNNSRRNLVVVFVLVIAALGGLGAYYFMQQKNNAPVAENEPAPATPIPADTTVKKDTLHTDTAVLKPADTVIAQPATQTVATTTDSTSFKVILKDYPTEATVNRAYAKLTEYGHKVEIIKIDSTHFKLAMPFNKPLSDTLKIRDSLRIFFGGKPYVLVK